MGLHPYPAEVQYQTRKRYFSNQEFPSGTFDGGRVFLSRSDLLSLASFIDNLPNGGRKASDWDVGLALLP